MKSRRDWRLASGLVLFGYVASHLINHALGLVSIGLADDVLEVVVRLWHSAIGTLLLYGAALVHIALALDAVFQRRTLRMPAAEALRIALGFTIPTLLIGHVIGTRTAFEMHQIAPEYHRVVWTLWTSDTQGRQLALLAPGWIHGCMGLHYAFVRYAAYRRTMLIWFGVALLLPVLSAAGVIAMLRELTGPGSETVQARLNETLATPVQARSLAQLRDTVLAIYFGAIGVVFVLRAMRESVSRRRRGLVSMRFPQRILEVPRGWTVLEASRGFGLAHASMCGGRARCSTCRVRITEGLKQCPSPQADERATLERIHATPDIRLACQLRPIGDIAIEPLVAVTATAIGRRAVHDALERRLAVLALRLHAQRPEQRLPLDALYECERIEHAIERLVATGGGRLVSTGSSSIIAVFGLNAPIAKAVSQAIDVSRQLAAEEAARYFVAAVIDVGPVAYREPMEAGSLLAAAGETLDRAQSSLTSAKVDATTLLVSPAAARAAEFDPKAIASDTRASSAVL